MITPERRVRRVSAEKIKGGLFLIDFPFCRWGEFLMVDPANVQARD